MRERRLRNGVNWQGALKGKGIKQGLGVLGSHFQTFTADVGQMLNLSGYLTCRILNCFRRFKGTIRFQVGAEEGNSTSLRNYSSL